MPTDTFTIANANDDGSGYWRDDIPYTWPPAESWVNDPADTILYVSKGEFGSGGGGAYYYATNVFFRWDTSSIPNSAVVTAASLRMYLIHYNKASTGWGMVGDYHDFGGEPSVAADGNENISPSIFTRVDLDPGFVENADLDCVLTDLSGINKTGYTGIRIGLDEGGRIPPLAGDDTAMQFAAYEFAGVHQARLIVTYTAGVDTEALAVSHGMGMGRW